MTFYEQYEIYRLRFEKMLSEACEEIDFTPSVLAESMKYSLLAGGKRLRPVLFLSALDLLGARTEAERDLAVAIECIHTYSLIHDDLPAMDNDDFRRGMPSSHRKFGEGNAILAGDALLSHALELLLRAGSRGERELRAAALIARAAGPRGMVAGQSADLLYGEDECAGERELLFIHANKTAAMIAAPLKAAAAVAGQREDVLGAFGERLGMLFQFTDDLLDDGEEGRLTAVKVYGPARAKELADGYERSCRELLQAAGPKARFLCDLAHWVRLREK